MTKETPPTEAHVPHHSISDDELYRHTSQYRLWSMTKEKLATTRLNTHQRAVEKIKQSLAAKSTELGFTLTPEQINEMVLTFEEEHALVLGYASKVERIARSFNMSSQVKATAVSYFRKFYLVYSVMDYHPKNILYTCVFLAAKAENFFVPVAKFCSLLVKSEPAHILDLEFLVLESLSFTLMVQNGIRPLHGFFLDLQAVLPTTPKQVLGDVLNNARSVLLEGLLSDALFHFTPPQIALAGLSLSNEDLIKQYLETKFSVTQGSQISLNGEDQEGIHDLNVLLQVINDCKEVLTNFKVPESTTEKEIDKKLYKCLHPKKSLNPAKRKLERSNSTPKQASPMPLDSASESPQKGPDTKRIKLSTEESISSSPAAS